MAGSFCVVCRVRIPKGSRCSQHRLVSPSSRAWRSRAQVRAAVLARDHGCVVCGSRDLLEVHHLEAAADGGETTLENLTVLCAVHHRQVEKGEITLTNPTNPTFTSPQNGLERVTSDREDRDGPV